MRYARIFGLLLVILVIAAVAPLVGCGKGGNPAPTPAVTPTATIPAEPSGETGTLSGIEGVVQVQRQGAGAWIVATSGMKIGTGDNLKTGDDGYVLITFFDGSVMEVESDTEISIEELSETSGGSTTVHINQVIGSTINRVENLVDSSSTYEVETLAGTAVVRGTIFHDEVERQGGITHTCISTENEDDEETHSVDFSNNGKTVSIIEAKTACCWQGGVPGNPFWTDPDDNPANFTGGGGGGGGCYGYGCGSPTPTPTPYYTPYMCSEGCSESMIGDGSCDEECYTEACSYDYGDCAN